MAIALEPMRRVRPDFRTLPALLNEEKRQTVRFVGLIGLLGLLNALDLAYTLFAYHIGMLDEMNPIAATYLAAGLKPSFIAYKLLMYIAGSVMLWRVRKSAWAAPACWAMVCVYVGVGVLWWEWAREVDSIYEFRIALSF
jgi:hypothetical protein